MIEPVRILGIAGSLRKGSYNRAALRNAVLLAPDGVGITTFDLAGIPPYSEDLDSTPPARVTEFKAQIRAADGILFVTPEYNYSVPGVLKNAIDWASRPYGDNAWAGKPAAIMGASTGAIGTARAQYHLRQVCVFLDVTPLNRPEVMIAHAARAFGPDNSLVDATARELIRELLVNLRTACRQRQLVANPVSQREFPIAAPIPR